VVLSVTVAKGFALNKASILATSAAPGVVGVVTNFLNDQWRLELTARSPGSANVRGSVSDQRGTTSQPVEFQVIVNPPPRSPTLPKPNDLVLEEGQVTTITLNTTADGGFNSNKMQLNASAGDSRVVEVSPTPVPTGWELRLWARRRGSTDVTVAIVDEGVSNQPVSFRVTVTPAPMDDLLMGQFEILAVNYGVLNPGDARTAAGKNAKTLPEKNQFKLANSDLTKLTELEKRFVAGRPAPNADIVADLKKKLNRLASF
jgi:hypothetical protein